MSETLDFFALDRAPFADESHASVVIGTRALRKVVSRIQATMRDGGTRIGVLGSSGIGKTSLVRALPKLFAGNTRVTAILDPAEDWKSVRLAIARDWQLGGGKLARAGLLGAAQGHRLVLVVDRAEEARSALLRHLDALQEIRDAEGTPAVTVILFVRSGQDDHEARPSALEWLEQSHAALVPFEPLAPDAVSDYIERQLQRAGYRGTPIFTPRAALAIHTETRGVPGEITGLCARLLADAAARRLRTIDEPFVRSRQDAKPMLVEITGPPGDLGEDAWDDADHHPRETPHDELLLENVLTSPQADARIEPLAHDLVGDPELEAYLSAPPTAAELRAIRGGFVRRNVWSFAAVSAVAVLGGFLIATLSPRERAREDSDSTANRPSATENSDLASANGPVLGRLRGPVAASPDREVRPAATAPRSVVRSSVQSETRLLQAGDLDDSALPATRRVTAEHAEPADEPDLPDDRPPDLAPPAGIETGIP